ncbi:transcriptional regulator SlyA [Pistricoccus aurantiacus]|uniref:Transcriptional regulator SlyA n=1 Tax=Pistricoccus aurantiacus TaxID=1883414 RepID=A0A5B8STK2_9GAMM|nr:transcriptional regulator SlyA [Pistricoccus aurantiacus]QEA40379.1 transcriptional regulator SlyA [Pistricoccus aurantiacus]
MYQNIGFRLNRVPRIWRAILDQRLAPLGLTQTRWITLYHLAHLGDGQPQCDLARAIGVEAPSLVRTLDQLAEQKLIERRPCEQDRRTKRIFLTAKAAPLLKQIDQVVDTARREILAGLDEDELAKFEELLSRIEKNVQKIQNKEDD